MNTNEQKRSLFSLAIMTAYLDGKLDQELTTEVEALLASDVDYAAAMEGLDREQSADATLARANRAQFEQSLRTMLEEKIGAVETPVRNLKRPKMRWLAVAAVILLLLMPLIYQRLKPKPSMQEIAMAHLDAYAFSGTKGQKEIATLLDSTLVFYEQGRLAYQANKAAYRDSLPRELEIAKQGFIAVITQPKDSMGIRQYLQAQMGLGVSLLFEGYPDAANEHLQVIIDHGNSEWTLDAAWYQGWAYLQLGQRELAIERFFELSRQKGLYRMKAQNLLDELE